MTDAKRTSTSTVVVAGGLFSGLAANFLGSKIPAIRNATETSQANTIVVIAVGFIIGAMITFLIMRSRTAKS